MRRVWSWAQKLQVNMNDLARINKYHRVSIEEEKISSQPSVVQMKGQGRLGKKVTFTIGIS